MMSGCLVVHDRVWPHYCIDVRTRYIVLIVVAVALVVTAILVTGSIGRGGGVKYGTRFPVDGTRDSTQEITVDQGDTFSLVVRDNASIGDNWTLESPTMPGKPDDVVAFDQEKYESGSDGVGGGGQRYYTFTAQRAGTARITLANRFRGGQQTYTATINAAVR